MAVVRSGNGGCALVVFTAEIHGKEEHMITRDAFGTLLHEADHRWMERRTAIADLVSRTKLLIFGFGGKGRAMAEQLRDLAGREVHIYDSAPDRRDLARKAGFPVLDALPKFGNAWAIILSACQAQLEQRRSVPGASIYYQEAATFFELPHLANLASDFQRQVTMDVASLFETYQMLHPASRARFLAVLKFRASLDPAELASVRSPMEAMWIDIPRLVKTRVYNTVMDVGAFDGDTLRAFRTHLGAQRGIAVEANTELFDSIRSVGSQYPEGIEIVPVAAWSRNVRLAFEEVRQGMIRVTESGDGTLCAARMDDHVREVVDFVKMDIEGAESEALAGCAGLLKESQPDLALAAYHRPKDLIDIMHQVERLGCSDDSFDWHVGHYSDCLDDTILYAIRHSSR
jgi:FkbM family methyltransferase